MSTRGTTVAVFVLVVVTVVAAVGAVPASGAASGVSETAVTPSTVETGDATTLSLSLTADGVDTSDGTSGATVTFSFSEAVDLSEATVPAVSVGPNATSATATVDESAGTVTVSWTDDTGRSGETLDVAVDVAGLVATRTGDASVTAAVDADATGDAEVTTTVGTVSAVASRSDRSVTEVPATLYLGEQNVDLTGLPGVNAAGGEQHFYGTSGDAEGRPAHVDDTLTADVTAANRFVTGGYAMDPASDTPQLSVVRPRVTDVTVSPGATSSSVDVANGSVPRSTTQLTVAIERNFADAENATVIVEDEASVDVTPQLTDAPTIAAPNERVTLDISGLDAGLYDVTVEGADDLDNASRTVSVRVRDPEKVVSFSKTRVVRGESSIVSVAGAPGDVRYLRLDAAALREGAVVNTPTARAVFDDTEAVQTIGADADVGVLYAVVSLDDDGLADVRLQTGEFATGSVNVELTTGLTGSVEDDTTLEVTERTLRVDELENVAVGESFTVSGTALESDQVKLYASVGESYVPLYEEDGDLAEPDVESDGSWSVELDTSRVVDLPGTYRVVAVADPGERLGSTERIDSEALRSFDVRGATSLTTTDGSLSLSASRTTIAATGTDEFTLSGNAVGQTDELRLYHVGPRGDADLTLVDERNGSFEIDISGVDMRGTHTYLVIGAGRDGTYAHSPDDPAIEDLLSDDETPSAALAVIRDAYTGAGSDDALARVDVRATDETLSITTPTSQLGRERVSLSGQSTAEDGTTVFVELTGDETVAFAEASVTNGIWNATLDLADVPTGTYRLTAETATTRTSREVQLTEAPSTTQSTATPSGMTATETESEPLTPSPTVTASTTDAATSAETTPASSTETRLPGFGGVSVIGAVCLSFLVTLVGWRRRRSGD